MHSTLFDAIDPAEQRLTAHVRAWTDQAIVPIDAAEIARRATATTDTLGPRARLAGARATASAVANPHRQGRSRAMFTTTQLIAAIALVALGTGALFLAGSPGPSPAVSPSPLPTWTPPSGLVTEEVGPGVLRVVSDDAGHDLASLGVVDIAVGAYGAVWMQGERGLFRLGRPGDPAGGGPRYRQRIALTVAPDGTVWGHWDNRVRSFVGGRWVDRGGHDIEALALGPDGTVWGAWPAATYWSEDGREPPGFELARLVGDAWVKVDAVGWPSELIGHVSAPYSPGLVATTDGALWILSGDLDGGAARFDGKEWEIVQTPTVMLRHAAGPDGSLWIFGPEEESGTRLARYVSGAWTEYHAAPEVGAGMGYGSEDMLRPVVASDGAVWMRRRGPVFTGFPDDCDGLVRFDGRAWSSYLPGTCINSVAAGRDGEVWVATSARDSVLPEPSDVYLIRPGLRGPVAESPIA